MVLVHQIQEPVKDRLAFLLSESIDVSNMAPDWEYAFPSGDWIGANHGMNGFQFGSNIFRCSSGFVVQLEAVLLRYLIKGGLCESRT